MKILRMISRATAGTLALTMVANASATELLFYYDEEGDGRDLQFILDSEPDPYYSHQFAFIVQNVVDQLTGQTFDQGYFWTPLTSDGGFSLKDTTDTFGPVVGGTGEQLFTGTPENPMFKVGTFDLISRTAEPEQNATLTISPVPATVVFDWDADGDGRDLRFSFDVAPSPYLAENGRPDFQLIDVIDELTNQTMRWVGFSDPEEGGFSVDGPGGFALNVNGEGLFFNTADAPVFRTGSFRLDGTSSGLLTITAQPLNAVPEPATWAMLLLGFAMIGGLMRASGNRPKIRVRYF